MFPFSTRVWLAWLVLRGRVVEANRDLVPKVGRS